MKPSDSPVTPADPPYDVAVVGAGLAGLSAAIYLGRSRRRTLIIESGRSMAVWEPDVQNYLGFPDGVSGVALLERGRMQALRYGAALIQDHIARLRRDSGGFDLDGEARPYRARRVLLATGLTHLPPEIPGVRECLGKSLFFCKDCDAFRVQGQRLVVIGQNNEAVDYALAMLAFSPAVVVATNGKSARWDAAHHAWLKEYGIPVRTSRICRVVHDEGRLTGFEFDDGGCVAVDGAFTTRGDVYHTQLAEQLGAALNEDGEVVVDQDMRTTVQGLYAAGCLTPANCQMIIAAGQGATAAQAINRDLFDESLREHRLPVWGGARRAASMMV